MPGGAQPPKLLSAVVEPGPAGIEASLGVSGASPQLLSMNARIDVWSNMVGTTRGFEGSPLVRGEAMMQGTRKPESTPVMVPSAARCTSTVSMYWLPGATNGGGT